MPKGNDGKELSYDEQIRLAKEMSMEGVEGMAETQEAHVGTGAAASAVLQDSVAAMETSIAAPEDQTHVQLAGQIGAPEPVRTRMVSSDAGGTGASADTGSLMEVEVQGAVVDATGLAEGDISTNSSISAGSRMESSSDASDGGMIDSLDEATKNKVNEIENSISIICKSCWLPPAHMYHRLPPA